MAGKVFGAPEQAKIKQIVSEGMTVLQEIDALQEGLNETIKAVAEELGVKPAIIKKAIKPFEQLTFSPSSLQQHVFA
jgi:DNA-binding MarR family transcriptional regulator